MKELVVASTNVGKIREIKAILEPLHIDVKSICDVLEEDIDIEENGQTFKENALIKAQTICDMVNLPTLADDSGLEVNALDGGPGIYSARFMGHDTSYDIKNQYIIDAVKGKDRQARFVCAMALCRPNEEPVIIEEYFNGEISDHIEGTGGFGYDPIFYVPELKKTSASLSLEEKNKYSHRGKALRKLYNLLKEEK